MCKRLILSSCALFLVTQAVVLDPALYLSPNPPFTGEPEALVNWSKPEVESSTELVNETQEDEEAEETETPQARTFWPIHPYSVKSIHIPLTFSLTGSYGTSAGSSGVVGSSYGNVGSSYGNVGSSYGNIGSSYGNVGKTPSRGIVASSYATVSDDYGKSGLAGSSYGLYRAGAGTRVYGGSGGAAWSGWGNGKWGHYGKG